MEYRATGPLLQTFHVTYQVMLARDLTIDTMFVDLGYNHHLLHHRYLGVCDSLSWCPRHQLFSLAL